MYAEREQESTGRGIENKFHFSKKILCKKNGEKVFLTEDLFNFRGRAKCGINRQPFCVIYAMIKLISVYISHMLLLIFLPYFFWLYILYMFLQNSA